MWIYRLGELQYSNCLVGVLLAGVTDYERQI